MHRRTGQQVSGTARPCDPVRERANKVFGKRSARLLKFFITARLPGRSPGPRATRLQRRLLRAATVAAQAAAAAAPTTTTMTTTTTTSSTIVRYVRHVPMCCFIMAVLVDVLLLFMLINTSSIFEINMLVALVNMLYIPELIMELLPNYPTIQKPYMCYRQFPELNMGHLSDALRPDKFTGVDFKRWQYKTTLWLRSLKVFEASEGLPEGTISDEDQNKFKETNTAFVGLVLSALSNKLFDVYMQITDAKELWEALNAKFGVADAGSELYIMESFHDFRMANNRSVVEHAHEIQCIAKELEHAKCALPDKFVAGCIIAKLPSSWRNFATTLKHKRQEISVENLIASLDIEEKARAKGTAERGGEGQSSANMVQKNFHHGKSKAKSKPSFNMPTKTTSFKKKKKMLNKSELKCYTCGELGDFSVDCPDRADKKGKKHVNVVTASNADGYGNLPIVLSVFQSPCWWIDTGANVHVCADISMFTSYQVADSSVLMGNGSHASVRGVGTVDLKFTSGKIVQLRNVQHVPTMNKNLVSGSLLCRDGFKLVLESNKVVVSKFGQFIGKGYECGGLFRFSLSEF